MKKIWKRWSGLLLAMVMVTTAAPMTAKADAVSGDENYTPYLALGADLKTSEKAKVYELMGITDEDVANFDVIEVTNEEEHEYLGEYVDASVIGTRALSSVLVIKQKPGYGISVETNNITYCSQGMYCNALITAGIENAKVIVAGPFEITGTAALVGAMEAYSVMTGEEITAETMDAAVNELVLTGALAQTLGDSEKVEELMAVVKQQIASGELGTPEEIQAAIAQASDKLGLQLTEDQIAQIMSLMEKMSQLDLDVNSLKEQAKGLYDKLSKLDLDGIKVDKEGIMASINQFFENFFQALTDFFKNLFK